MSERNGRLGQNGSPDGGHQSDVFCRSVVAALAAVLAFAVCQYLRRIING